MFDEVFKFLKPILERDEGKITYLYSDKKGGKVKITDPYGGKITIGIGWNIEDRGLPDDIIYLLLEIGVKDAFKDAQKLYPNFASMSLPRQAACVNLCYNMGYPTLLSFTTTNTLIRSNQFSKAADRLRKTLYAKQVGLRALRIANLLEFERE